MTRLLMINYGGHIAPRTQRSTRDTGHSFMPGKWVDHRSQEGYGHATSERERWGEGERLGRLLGP